MRNVSGKLKNRKTLHMSEHKEAKEKDVYLSLFIKIAIGLFILSIVFPFGVNAVFSNWAKSGTFGDTFGALNAFFSGLALAGVIVTILIQRTELENQRIELSLQRDEMQETRKEFLLNRATTLVYSQLDRFEQALSEFTIKVDNGKVYKGNDAILYLHNNETFVSRPFDKSEEDYNSEMRLAIIKLLCIYSPNKSNLDKFAHSAYNSVEVLKRLIYKTNLDVEHLNDLKNLFFVNVGFVNMGVLKRISEITKLQFEYLITEDYIEHGLEIGCTMHADIFIKSIVKFHQLYLTSENLEENRNEWLKSIGELEK